MSGLYRAETTTFSRSRGNSSVAKLAYRRGERLHDRRTGKTYDFSKKPFVEHVEVLAPDGAPDWVQDPEEMWNRVEAAETRKNSQLARDLELAIPDELSRDQALVLGRNHARQHYVSRGMVVNMALHSHGDRAEPGSRGWKRIEQLREQSVPEWTPEEYAAMDRDERFRPHLITYRDGSARAFQPHFHKNFPGRELTPDGFGAKRRDWESLFADYRVGNGKKFANKDTLKQGFRLWWEQDANTALEAAGVETRISRLSRAERGLAGKPEPTLGIVWNIENRTGKKSDSKLAGGPPPAAAPSADLAAAEKRAAAAQADLAWAREELRQAQAQEAALAGKPRQGHQQAELHQVERALSAPNRLARLTVMNQEVEKQNAKPIITESGLPVARDAGPADTADRQDQRRTKSLMVLLEQPEGPSKIDLVLELLEKMVAGQGRISDTRTAGKFSEEMYQDLQDGLVSDVLGSRIAARQAKCMIWTSD